MSTRLKQFSLRWFQGQKKKSASPTWNSLKRDGHEACYVHGDELHKWQRTLPPLPRFPKIDETTTTATPGVQLYSLPTAQVKSTSGKGSFQIWAWLPSFQPKRLYLCNTCVCVIVTNQTVSFFKMAQHLNIENKTGPFIIRRLDLSAVLHEAARPKDIFLLAYKRAHYIHPVPLLSMLFCMKKWNWLVWKKKKKSFFFLSCWPCSPQRVIKQEREKVNDFFFFLGWGATQEVAVLLLRLSDL